MDEQKKTSGSLALNSTPRVITIAPSTPVRDRKLRVAAYARVSSSSEDQLNSFAAQNAHYTELITDNPEWEFVDVYADKGITGTSAEKRDDFQRLLADCRRGRVDKILVKSSSRFARNAKECLEAVRELEDIPFSSPYEEECPIRDLGTLGGGNHFAEFQCVERIYDQEAAGSLGLCADRILLLVHCGSRGYGQEILSRFWVPEGLADGSEQAEAYMAEHDRALRWAVRNRRAAAQKLLAWLGGASEPELLMDSCHNYLERTKDGLLHRKGSVSASKGAVVIPGSRGSLTYVCIPREDTAVSLNSLSHGAGRKWARSICKSRIDQKYDRDSIRCTGLKSRVVCHDTNLLFAEAPEAYKNVEQVMGVLQEYGLIDIAATLRPLITFKG